MNVLRKIGLALMIIVFIFTTAFGIFIAGSSHGSLVFSHSDEKLIAMVSAKRLGFEPSYFLTSKKIGFQISKETRENGVITKTSYKFHLDKDSQLSAITSESTQKDETYTKNETYYKDGILYSNINGVKKQEEVLPTAIVDPILTEINLLQDNLVNNIPTSKNKAIIDFSFSPFYFLGIKYTIKEEAKVTTYKYDLSGNLRKITVKHKDGKNETYSFNYKDDKLSFEKIYEF